MLGDDVRGRVPCKPIMKWVGGKYALLKKYQELGLLPDDIQNRRLVDPFCGSGAPLFRLAPMDALLSDSNPDITALLTAIRDQPEELCELLDRHQEEFDAALKAGQGSKYHNRWQKRLNVGFRPIRQTDMFAEESADEPLVGLERAAVFYAVTQCSYNALCRYGPDGHNAGYCHAERNGVVPVISRRDRIMPASAALKGVDIRCADFRNTVKEARSGDILFVDNPYFPTSKTANFTKYTRGGFRGQDHLDLRDALNSARERGVTIFKCDSCVPWVAQHYPEPHWTLDIVERQGTMNSKKTGRSKVPEYVVRSRS